MAASSFNALAQQAAAQPPVTAVPDVDVNGQASSGAAIPGVITPPQQANMGPAGAQKPLDSPYQTNVISQEIIQSQNLRSTPIC